jgi:hypothetical protein
MLVRSFQQGLVHLLAVTMLAIFVAHTADATIKSERKKALKSEGIDAESKH